MGLIKKPKFCWSFPHRLSLRLIVQGSIAHHLLDAEPLHGNSFECGIKVLLRVFSPNFAFIIEQTLRSGRK